MQVSDQYEEWQSALRQAIAVSPVISICECGEEIREAEIEFGVATEDECAKCVRDEVVEML